MAAPAATAQSNLRPSPVLQTLRRARHGWTKTARETRSLEKANKREREREKWRGGMLRCISAPVGKREREGWEAMRMEGHHLSGHGYGHRYHRWEWSDAGKWRLRNGLFASHQVYLVGILTFYIAIRWHAKGAQGYELWEPKACLGLELSSASRQ